MFGDVKGNSDVALSSLKLLLDNVAIQALSNWLTGFPFALRWPERLCTLLAEAGKVERQAESTTGYGTCTNKSGSLAKERRMNSSQCQMREGDRGGTEDMEEEWLRGVGLRLDSTRA